MLRVIILNMSDDINIQPKESLSVKTVASYFIEKAGELGDGNEELSGNNDLTNLKLQKLLYFAQAEHLQKYNGVPLFSEEIHAWKYGPVVPEVYNWLKDNGSLVITEFDADLDDTDTIPADKREFLDNVWDKYGNLSAWSLVQMTHKQGSAWDRIYHSDNCDRTIPLAQIMVEAV